MIYDETPLTIYVSHPAFTTPNHVEPSTVNFLFQRIFVPRVVPR